MRTKFFRNISAILLMIPLCALVLRGNGGGYPSLTESRVIIQGDSGTWDANHIHTLSIVKADRGGYKYWGYYGLAYYAIYGGLDTNLLKAGLARSNDLIHWHKYQGNPIIDSDCRWPTVVLYRSTFYMFYAQYDHVTNDSRIVMLTSKDGIHFHNMVVVVPKRRGMQNQNPFIYFNKRDGHFYLFYYNGIEKSRDSTSDNWNIMVRKSKSIDRLKDANPMILLSSRHTMAAPSIAFFRNKYYLLIEAWNPAQWGKNWVTLAYESNKIEGKYRQVSNSPILVNNDACAFEYIFHNQLNVFYSHCLDTAKSYWELKMVKAVR